MSVSYAVESDSEQGSNSNFSKKSLQGVDTELKMCGIHRNAQVAAFFVCAGPSSNSPV